MRDEFWDEQFKIIANTPGIWVLQARELKCAADLIFNAYVSDFDEMQRGGSTLDLQNLQIVGPATLLYGLAFENVIKAIILKKEGAMIENGKLKRWPGSGHELIELAERAGIRLTDLQRELLSRFTAFIEWSGRYPIPMSKDKMSLQQAGISPEWIPLPVQPNELTSVCDFYLALDAQIIDASEEPTI